MINITLNEIYFFLGGLILSGIIFSFCLSKVKKENKALKKQYEKKSIGMDDSSLRVKTLENKIKTLEAALEKVQKNG